MCSAAITHTDLLLLLTALTTLVKLDIGLAGNAEGPCVGKEFPKLLTYDPSMDSKSALLPKLEILKLAGPLPFMNSAFVDMVESRWAAERSIPREHRVSQIRHISLRYHQELDMQSISWLDKYHWDGLYVFIQKASC
jgi:hypothetical protein